MGRRRGHHPVARGRGAASGRRAETRTRTRRTAQQEESMKTKQASRSRTTRPTAWPTPRVTVKGTTASLAIDGHVFALSGAEVLRLVMQLGDAFSRIDRAV